jgi:pantoate--beta-alanine ligase
MAEPMVIVDTVMDARGACRELRRGGRTLGLVPTMGALHEGHVSLVRAARESCEVVVATIFVNPTQFAPGEDFAAYPRTFEADCAMLQREGVDLVFAPAAAEMYPVGAATWVDVPEVGGRLDGASRPGHFRGVATVVSKLLHIVQPDKTFFGQKDAAQVAVLQAMVRDLNFDTELVVCPTVRETDGLAMSSRNRYLSAEERDRALALSRSLRVVGEMAAGGELDAAVLRGAMLAELESTEGVRVDYAEVVDPGSLLPVSDVSDGAMAAVAAWVGKTRLIDNVLLAAGGVR